MNANTYLALINPLMALILSAAFLIMWFLRRRDRYVLVLSFSYAMCAAAFLARYWFNGSAAEFGTFVSNVLFTSGMAVVCYAIAARYRLAMPHAVFVGIGVVCVLAIALGAIWPELSIVRAMILNLACGVMLGVLGVMLVCRWNRLYWWDRLVAFSVLLAALHFPPRIYLSLHTYIAPADAPMFETTFWALLSVSVALFSVLFALSLFAAIVGDMMVELRASVVSDPLTGVANRRGLEEKLSSRGKPAERAVIMADIDRFKSINDRYGHAVGDEVLVAFARCLEEVAGEAHIVARMGGEEFMVVADNLPVPAARMMAETMCRHVGQSISAGDDGHGVSVTASFGLAIGVADEPIEAIMHRADMALYRAKDTGRNRVETATALNAPEDADDRVGVAGTAA
ncbi:MAG: GGDEF domain-containing protein [Pseudomonadota bacterium]